MKSKSWSEMIILMISDVQKLFLFAIKIVEIDRIENLSSWLTLELAQHLNSAPKRRNNFWCPLFSIAPH